jgi:hypothetical protein
MKQKIDRCRAIEERIELLERLHKRFSAIVKDGQPFASAWHAAKPEHRDSFEMFFTGCKPLVPPPAASAAAVPHNSTAAPRNSTAAKPLISTPATTEAVTTTTASPEVAAAAPPAVSQPLVQLAPSVVQFAADPTFSMWALSRGLGAAVPPPSDPEARGLWLQAMQAMGVRAVGAGPQPTLVPLHVSAPREVSRRFLSLFRQLCNIGMHQLT